MFRKRRQKERAQAIVLLSQISEPARQVLLGTYTAFKAGDVVEANRWTMAHPNDVAELLEVLGRPRDRRLSAGPLGDELNITVWVTELNRQKYSEQAVLVLAAVHHHYLDTVLQELVTKRSTSGAHPREQEPMDADRVHEQQDEAVADTPVLPEWLEEKATRAPTMFRVAMEALEHRFRREHPRVIESSDWHHFVPLATVGGCVALGLRLHVDVPDSYRTPLELAMRSSLELGSIRLEQVFNECTVFVRDSLLDVERSRRREASFVLIALWVFGQVAGGGSLDQDPQLVAELAAVYQNESASYWVSV